MEGTEIDSGHRVSSVNSTTAFRSQNLYIEILAYFSGFRNARSRKVPSERNPWRFRCFQSSDRLLGGGLAFSSSIKMVLRNSF